MTNVTREKAKAITADIQKAIAHVLEEHGFEESKVHTTYGDRYEYKLTLVPSAPRGENGVRTNTPEAQALAQYGRLYLSHPSDSFMDLDSNKLLGLKIYSKGVPYVLIGLNTRAPKYPFLALNHADGKTYKLTGTSVGLGVRNALALADA